MVKEMTQKHEMEKTQLQEELKKASEMIQRLQDQGKSLSDSVDGLSENEFEIKRLRTELEVWINRYQLLENRYNREVVTKSMGSVGHQSITSQGRMVLGEKRDFYNLDVSVQGTFKGDTFDLDHSSSRGVYENQTQSLLRDQHASSKGQFEPNTIDPNFLSKKQEAPRKDTVTFDDFNSSSESLNCYGADFQPEASKGRRTAPQGSENRPPFMHLLNEYSRASGKDRDLWRSKHDDRTPDRVPPTKGTQSKSNF